MPGPFFSLGRVGLFIILALTQGATPGWVPIASSAPLTHPIHLSNAEVQLNLDTSRLEVALQVFPEDLDEALTRRVGKPVRIDETRGVNEWILAYVEDCFWVGRDRARGILWVGKQVSFRETWLYFEIPVVGEFRTDSIQNRMFFELFDDQVNHIVVTQKFGPPFRYATVESMPEPVGRDIGSWWSSLRVIWFQLQEQLADEMAFEAIATSRDLAGRDIEEAREPEDLEADDELRRARALDRQTLQFLEDHLRTLRDAKDILGTSRCLISLARLSHQLGQDTDAYAYLIEAIPLIEQHGGAFERVQALEAAAALVFARDELEKTCRWLAFAERQRLEHEISWNPSEAEEQERLLGRSREELGREAFAESWGGGFRARWEDLSGETKTYFESLGADGER